MGYRNDGKNGPSKIKKLCGVEKYPTFQVRVVSICCLVPSSRLCVKLEDMLDSLPTDARSIISVTY
jgi:hypothetical protein